jgi:hypothetical protein
MRRLGLCAVLTLMMLGAVGCGAEEKTEPPPADTGFVDPNPPAAEAPAEAK